MGSQKNADGYLETRSLQMMQEIASQPNHEDPFYFLDVGNLIHKVEVWRRLMPRVDIFYAVKCNDHEAVLDTLVSLGTGFDCASKSEIERLTGNGVCPSRIIYAHTCKSDLDLQYASKMRVTLMTFDSPEELVKVKENCPEAELVLRIQCDATSASYSFGKKFGASMDDTVSILTLARDLGLKVVGVSFHVGSGCKEVTSYERAIASSKKVFDDAEALGIKMNLLDVGGGFPGKGLEEFASMINSSLDVYFPEENNQNLKIIGEPGRYIVTSAFTLATCITSKKKIKKSDDISVMYYVNDGVYGSFNTHLFENEPFSPKVLLRKRHKENEEGTKRSMIWGPTCCALDVLKKDTELPNLECGDWLYWPDMGAYTITCTTPFNGFPAPKVYWITSSGELSLWKRDKPNPKKKPLSIQHDDDSTRFLW